MTVYNTSPACFQKLLQASQDHRDKHTLKTALQLQAVIATATDAVQEASERGHTIDLAREQWATDELEIDDYPLTSQGEDGCWVAAWVWVEAEG